VCVCVFFNILVQTPTSALPTVPGNGSRFLYRC